MLRAGSQTMGSFARRRAARFNWQRCVGPFTEKKVVDHCKQLQAKLNAKQAEADSAPKTVDAIDWAQWEKNIKAPGVVAALKKEYETLQFEDIQLTTCEETQANNEKYVKLAQLSTTHAQKEFAAADKVISKMEKARTDIVNWTWDDWEAHLPGLQQQLHDEYDDEKYHQSNFEDRLWNLDWKGIQDDMAKGVVTELEDSTELERVGDAGLTGEMAAVEAGEWSVGRLFQGKEERAQNQAEVRKYLGQSS